MPESSAQSARPLRPQLSQRLGRFWTIPNMLSILRLGLVVPITYLVWTNGALEWLFGLIVLGALTDFLDGRVARWSHAVSGWGKVLDPMADKFAAVMVISALTVRGAEPTLPLWFLAVVIGRDLCILVGGIIIARRTGQVAQSGALGKAAVAALALTVLYAVLGADPAVLDYCVWISTVLLAGSFLIYLGRYLWVERTGGLPTRARRESEPLDEGEGERGKGGAGERKEWKNGGTEEAAASPNGAASEKQQEQREPATENGISRTS